MKRARSYLVISMLAFSAGCMTWTRPEPPGTALPYVDSHPIRVARADHSVIVLKNASVQGDSLIGIADDGTDARISIPVSDIQGVSARELSPGRTLALAGGVILSAFGVLLIALIVTLTHSNWE